MCMKVKLRLMPIFQAFTLALFTSDESEGEGMGTGRVRK